jgi:hypothetical protein
MFSFERYGCVDKKTRRSMVAPYKDVLKGLLAGGIIGSLIIVLAAKTGPMLIKSDLSDNQLFNQLAEARQILTVWDLLVIPLLYLIILGTHEIGHLLAGLSQGMQFLMLIVGPFGWHASVSGTRFEWNTNVALMGGIAATVPKKVGASLQRQLLVMIAGGPIASLLLAIFAIELASVSNPRFAVYCVFVGVTSFGIFLVTLIPVRTGGFMSDGLQMIDVLRGGRVVIERAAILQICSESLDGVRPRDWDASAIKELTTRESKDPLRSAGGSLYLFYRAMDCRNDADIMRYRKLLESGVDHFPSGFRQSIYVELAISAWLVGETEAVRQNLEASKGGIVEKSRRLLAQAGLAKLEGREADCQRDCLLTLKALEKASDAGIRKFTEDQLQILIES